MKAVAPVSVLLKPSRRLLVLQSLAHVVAAGVVMVSPLPFWLAGLLLILVGFSWARVRRSSPLTGLVLRGDGGIETIGPDAVPIAVVIHPHTLVLSFLVVLLYRQNNRLQALTLLSDSLSAEDFRQLRLWLRWRGLPGPAESMF